MKRLSNGLKKCLLAAIVLLPSQFASAATADAMGQGILYMVLYTLVLIIPLPYSFLLAVYALSFKKNSAEDSMLLRVTSILTLIFVALVAMAIYLKGFIATLNAWGITFGVIGVAVVLITILGYKLFRLGKMVVVIALLPISAVLSIVCLAFAGLIT